MKTKAFLGLAAAVLGLTVCAQPAAAAPLYEWNFNGASGVPNVTAGGGTLTITNSLNGASTFAGTGVSGVAGDNAYDGFNGVNQYNTANPAGIASTTAANVATGFGTLSQFTVTFWMKPNNAFRMPNQNGASINARLMMAGTSASYDQGTGGFHVSLNDSNRLQRGVNGANPITSQDLSTFLPSRGIAPDDWVFVAFGYDSDPAVFFNTNIRNATGNEVSNNAYMYLGGRHQQTVLYDGGAVLAGGNVTPGAVSLGSSAFVFAGNRSNLNRDFTGLIDNLQIHNTLLNKADLEAVRLSVPGNTVPEPASATALALAAAALLARRRRA